MNYDRIIHDVVEEYRNSPIDILDIGAVGEYRYLTIQKPAYISTIRDIDTLCNSNPHDKKILEIGSFLGPVSISLKRMGYSVYALDIPEFYQSSSLKSLYAKHAIPFAGQNLRKRQLPYECNCFDAVILCEVIEHLNFNPLPVFKEINRVLKKDGYMYIRMPNQSSLENRVRLLLGKSIHNPIDDYFAQLDKHDNMIVGLHWREYTMSEAVRLIEKMGFKTTLTYYFWEPGSRECSRFKALLERCLYYVPSFRPQQVVVGKKVLNVTYDFWFTDANL
jgi:SAM-dependent methyltransferase